MKNGKTTGRFLYLSESNGWKGVFDQLDAADAEGNTYEYSVKEHLSDQDSYETSYETETDANGNLLIKITNKLNSTVEIPVEKIWADGNDKHADTSVEVQLMADGEEYENGKVLLNKENNWKYTFKNLPKYRNDGKTEIQYTVKEIEVSGYKSEISGNMEDGYTITNTPVVIKMPETGVFNKLNAAMLGIGLLIGGFLLMINIRKRGWRRRD